MKITLSYTICTAEPWNSKFNYVGEYKLKQRKTPEETKLEREAYKSLYNKTKKVNPYRFSTESVFTVEGNTCYFLIGSWQRLQEELDKQKEPYTIEDKRDPALKPEPDFSKLEGVELRAGQAETLALLTSSDCGMICCTVGFGKSFLIKQLCKIYPTLKILITCASGEVVKELYRDIHSELPKETGLLNMDNNNIDGKRIIVTTMKSMEKLKDAGPQLVIADECHCIGDSHYGKVLTEFCFARRFGFTATPIRNQGDFKALESVLGPVIQEFGFQEAVDAGSVTQLSYAIVPVDHKSEWLNKELPDYIKTRYYYTQNYSRNDAIISTFYKIYKSCPNVQILIMVNTIEHLIRLHEHMPFLGIVHGERGALTKYNSKKGLEHVDMSKYVLTSKQVDITKHALEKGTLRAAISTSVLNQGVNLKHLAVLIRADGATSGIPSLQIPGRLARLDANKPMAYLIDFSDGFCDGAAARAKARVKVYKQNGWKETTVMDIIEEINNRDCSDAEN